MSQHDYVLDNGPGLAVRTDMNAAVKALASNNSGPVAPAVPYAGMFWLDTSAPASYPNGLLRMRNAGNTGWVGLSFDGDKIVNLPLPVATTDVATKAYVDSEIAEHQSDGGTITGNINVKKSSPMISVQRTANTEAPLFAGYDENTKRMWALVMGNGTGKDFSLNRYDVNGASVGASYICDWSTGRNFFYNGMTLEDGLTISGGGLTTDNITQRQSSSTANLYHTWANSSGYTEWNFRMANDTKEMQLRCYDGTSAGTLMGYGFSARSLDGAIQFPSGIYALTQFKVAGECIRFAGGSTDSPYMTWYQGGSRRGYIQYYYNSASAPLSGMKFYNDATDEYLLLSNTGGADSLILNAQGVPYPVYHRGNLFYTGSTHTNLSFPVGSMLMCYYNNESSVRNAAYVVRLSSDTMRYLVGASSGSVVAGTWRARGQHSDVVLMQRTA